ncbi:DNA repair endonuclease XPF [Zancudomyces culisetae]|uniref:DNA repair endonuclease XPF n=1 Tax=Zancudomyces culisetae TaxID=1213189 RepID=A0A1R1PIE0_ZANCU|nr:DNA repair endonuclease XPF [Zancudomyces culisetae]|eukprot:OMH80751.1 DNA repair endonuclease XPF [Zancudomyces culisetae]
MVCNEATREQLSGYLSEADDSKKGLNKCMLKSYKEYMENRLIQKNSDDTEASSMGNPAGNSGKNNANKRRRVRKTSDSVSGSSGSSVATFAGVIDIDGGTGEQNSQNETTVDPAYYGVVEAQVVIQAYAGIKNMETLEKYRPTTVIMYSPNTEFIRQLEIYGGNIKKVYFMVYDNSVEEQKYLSQIRKEKTSFETLINEKSSMAIQLVDKGITDSPPPISFVSTENDLQPLHQNKTATVIVDAREFRSALPFALYNKGIMVVPRTLLIGDYVLHDQLCVERKAVPDLIQSLASGRLYSQAGAMREHYKSSALLIEFEPNSLFLGDYYFRTERASQLFPVKLAQLLISYKELRLIWSPSPQFTAKLFLDLKSRFPEPDSHRAEQAGKSSVTLTNNYRSSSLKLLNSLPGLSAGTQSLAVYNLANSSKNFTHLCSLSVKQLSSILDPKLASSLHSFLHHTF